MSGSPGFLVNFDVEPSEQGLRICDMAPGQFVSCVYDRKWRIGSIKDVSDTDQDIQVNFMHPHGPA